MSPIADAQVLELLSQAAAGLLYPSETDAPLEPFCWPGHPGRSARDEVAVRAPQGAAVEQASVTDFFSELDASPDADRFRRLRSVLESHLAGLSVFRVGSRRIDVYVVGKTPSDTWAGLHTLSVET